MNRIVIIGSGNVATHLGHALDKAGHSIVQVFGRTKARAVELANRLSAKATDDIGQLDQSADFYIISINDDAIPDVAGRIRLKDKIAVHTSGSVAMEALSGITENTGVFYPVQTFKKGRVLDFRDIPVCVEAANPETMKILTDLGRSISGTVHPMNSGQRRHIHLAAVFACNFTNHLYAISSEILSEHKIPTDILLPLIRETAALAWGDDPGRRQTGPALRNDRKVMEMHVKMLEAHPFYQKLYKLVSQSIIEKHLNQ